MQQISQIAASFVIISDGFSRPSPRVNWDYNAGPEFKLRLGVKQVTPGNGSYCKGSSEDYVHVVGTNGFQLLPKAPIQLPSGPSVTVFSAFL